MWEELYENHYKELVAYGSYLSGSRELAEDLAQETFVKALMNADTIEDLSRKKQRAWLYRTFRNLFFDYYRRAVLESEYAQSGQPGFSEDTEIQRVENEIFLQTVSPQDHAIFQLRYFEGYTAEEIGRILNLPSGTIRSKLSRCRKYLKKQLEI